MQVFPDNWSQWTQWGGAAEQQKEKKVVALQLDNEPGMVHFRQAVDVAMHGAKVERMRVSNAVGTKICCAIAMPTALLVVVSGRMFAIDQKSNHCASGNKAKWWL